MIRRSMFLVCLLCGACALPQPPEPPTASPPPASAQDLQAVQQEVGWLRQRIDNVDARMQRAEQVLPAQAAQIQSLLPLLHATASSRKGRKAVTTSTPLQIVEIAHREAQVTPTQHCYYGRSGECLFTYQPGRIYTLYLTPWHPTVIALEPGERLSIGFMLDEKLYDVVNKVVGEEARAYSAISIRPLFDTGTADGFLVTESGRRYLFHFVIGAKGMVAATFETPTITRTPEPRLVLPKPQS